MEVQAERGLAARPLLPIINLRSGFTVLEEIKEALLDALDGSEEFINAHSLAGHFVNGQARVYGITELTGTSDTFRSQQREHRERILLARLALLPFLNGPGRLAHIIHGIPEFPEDARIEWARAHFILEPDEVGAGFLQLEISAPEGFAGDKELDGNP